MKFKKKYQKVKGMEDYYPKEETARKAIFAKLREQAKKFGFQEVSSPAVETSALLTAKSGEEIKEQLFNFEKKGKEELALRFDLTVPLTRMFAAKQRELPKPVKWFSLDRMWRYESPQKGRNREFYQLSVEMFGSANPEADAQCINLAIACLKSLGITNKNAVVKINNRKLLEGLLLEIVNTRKLEAVIKTLDKSSKISGTEFIAELEAIGLTSEDINNVKAIVSCKGKENVLDKIDKLFKINDCAKQGLAELKETLKFIDDDWIEIDLSIARGLAYYTGNVYECFDRGGQYRALFGGGRYDQLVELFGGESTPATGFGLGISTLILFLEDLKLLPKPETGPEYYIAPVDEKMLPAAIKLAEKLRKKTSADVDLMRRKLAKQFEYAESIGAKKVIIVGEKDLKAGKVTVKDLKSGEEEKVRIDYF